MEHDKAWESMTHEEKQEWLFRQQKDTLDRFLEHGQSPRSSITRV